MLGCVVPLPIHGHFHHNGDNSIPKCSRSEGVQGNGGHEAYLDGGDTPKIELDAGLAEWRQLGFVIIVVVVVVVLRDTLKGVAEAGLV